ncbi:hypothetical protein ACH5RR_031586 [Cinchona calisaya]|uniref:Uncharacterized protein n=1 Tax=Cinchona calisaya TaxID=153742 RepID=A0ABD2YFN3_9GENT
MPCSTFKPKYKPIRRNDSGESEDIPLATTVSKNPLGGGIRKCPPSVLAKLGDKGKLQASHPRFGPFYRADESEVSGKKESWEKILEKSSDDDEKNKTIESYLSAMRRVEKDARDAYGGDKALYYLTDSEFRWMMIQDGCFFLQLALLALGVSSTQLGYSDNHIIFGKKQNKLRWIESMFFVGNQIPLVVLNELMKQDFFQRILHNETCTRDVPSSDLCKKMLCELLVLPALDYTSKNHQPKNKKAYCDLLHALHSLMLGKGRDLIVLQDEAGDLDPQDLEAAGGLDKDLTFSATELAKKGIRFGKAEQLGCMGCMGCMCMGCMGCMGCKNEITFKDYKLFACLYLPTFTVDDYTELIWRSLKCYEMTMSQQQEAAGKGIMSSCAVRSYLQFMNDLICTYEDVKVLEKKGIIKANNPSYKDKLPVILSKLVGKDGNNYYYHNQNLHLLRIKLRDYTLAPWERFKIVAILLFVLAIIQTFFAILAYFRPTNPQK